jgi:hypothetical protein
MAETVKTDWRRWSPLAGWRDRRAYWRTVPMRELRPDQTVDAIVDAVRSFGRQMDDQTLLVLRVL